MLFRKSTSNAYNSTLNGNIGVGDSSIVVTSATGLQFPGVLVIDRVNSGGTLTPIVREYITYTGISTNTLTGVVRGQGGSTAQAHSSGAVIEEVMGITEWNDLITALGNAFTSAGALDTTKVIDLTSSQTLTNKTLTSPIRSTVAVTGSTPTLDLSAGSVFTTTLGANTTFSVSNAVAGQFFIVEVTQGSGTTYTNTWFSGITWVSAGGTAPVQTATSNGITTYGFHCTGTNTYTGYLVGTS